MSTNKLPKILGIVNSTPDSFSGGLSVEKATTLALAMAEAGVEALDIGGESTRPGANEVPEYEELARILPVIRAVSAAYPEVILSVDTRKSKVATEAVKAGAKIINDVSMLMFDEKMIDTIRELDCGIIIAHNRGTPATMNSLACYQDVVGEVYEELAGAIDRALVHGIGTDKIIIDPNLGFAKNTEQNLEILRNLNKFRELGFPILIGHSRKRFIGEVCKITEAAKRDGATLALSVALSGRADYVRVHNAIEHVQYFKLLRCIQ